MGPDKNKEFPRFSTENGSSYNGNWGLFACFIYVCVSVLDKVRGRVGGLSGLGSLATSQSLQVEILSLEGQSQVDII